MVTISTVARPCGCEQYEAFCTTVQVCSSNSVTTNKMTITKPSLLRTNFGADKPNQAGIQCLQKQLAKQQPRCLLCTCSFGVWCPVFLQSTVRFMIYNLWTPASRIEVLFAEARTIKFIKIHSLLEYVPRTCDEAAAKGAAKAAAPAGKAAAKATADF